MVVKLQFGKDFIESYLSYFLQHKYIFPFTTIEVYLKGASNTSLLPNLNLSSTIKRDFFFYFSVWFKFSQYSNGELTEKLIIQS